MVLPNFGLPSFLWRVSPFYPLAPTAGPGGNSEICLDLRNTLFRKKPFWTRTCMLELELAWAVGVPVGQRSGGRLATTSMATENVIIFVFFSSVRTFSHWRVLGSKTSFCKSWQDQKMNPESQKFRKLSVLFGVKSRRNLNVDQIFILRNLIQFEILNPNFAPASSSIESPLPPLP